MASSPRRVWYFPNPTVRPLGNPRFAPTSYCLYKMSSVQVSLDRLTFLKSQIISITGCYFRVKCQKYLRKVPLQIYKFKRNSTYDYLLPYLRKPFGFSQRVQISFWFVASGTYLCTCPKYTYLRGRCIAQFQPSLISNDFCLGNSHFGIFELACPHIVTRLKIICTNLKIHKKMSPKSSFQLSEPLNLWICSVFIFVCHFILNNKPVKFGLIVNGQIRKRVALLLYTFCLLCCDMFEQLVWFNIPSTSIHFLPCCCW